MQIPKKYILYFACWQAWIATLGSLYFSEIAHFIPCTLCWYQRICMYPLAAILSVSIWDKNMKVYRYVFPLSIIGWLIAFYHNLIIWNIIPEHTAQCAIGVPCNAQYINWLGFITIPLLSFTAFTIINICMFFYRRNNT
jgi:disulfide bond formation protein DsbB